MDIRLKTSSRQHFLAGLRRAHRSALRRANWQYLPVYWQLRKYVSKLSFVFSRRRHSVNDRVRASRESFQIIVLILRSAGGAFFLGLVLVVVTGFIEVGLKRLFHAGEPFFQTRPLLNSVAESIRKLRFDGNAASGLLGTLAQIAGVLLGLYFAVVGTLVSTRYASVPPKIRDLLVADKLGNQYIKVVALFGAVAILLLGAMSLSIPIGMLNIVMVSCLGIATILSFVMLGRRAFEFFDPGALAHQLSGELVGWIDRAAKLKTYGREPAFQAHYQKKAAKLLDSYEGIVKLAAEEEVSQQHTLPYLARHSLAILGY